MFSKLSTKLIPLITPNRVSLSTAAFITSPTVSIKQGELRGTVQTLYNGAQYYSFKGIPYAQPPVGELRFKAPLPPKPWHGILEAKNHGAVCVHKDMFTGQAVDGDENCLFLNVYTPSLENTKLPVMVFIHGGAFVSGSGDSDMYGPEFLLQHNIILVTFNYRLDALGFLCLDTPEVPGNAGMKDQVAALRWVKNNIEKFGGDPDNVTLFGESAGAVAVTHHMLSPMSKGLFSKAISQSGVFLNDWAQQTDARARAFKLAMYLGKETEDTKELYNFLMRLPAEKLVGSSTKTRTNPDEKYRGLPIYFSPVIEKQFNGVECFLCENSVDLLLANKLLHVPLLIGYNSHEGIPMSQYQVKNVDFYNKHPEYWVPTEIAQTVSLEKMKELGLRIRKFYVGNRDFTKEDVLPLIDEESDVNFSYNIHRFVDIYSRFSKPIYMYRLSLSTELNLIKNLMGARGIDGACHADDLYYIFTSAATKDMYEENEKLKHIVYRITKLWTDFAKTGNPTPDKGLGITWTPYTTHNKEYMELSNEEWRIGNYADRDRMEFWNKLYRETGRPCMTKSNL